MKKRKLTSLVLIAGLCMGLLFETTAFAQDTNKAWSTETVQLYYTGTIQFVPSFVVPADAGYYLTQGKNVKQAYVNYTRDNESVTTNGGRLYTGTASSTSQTTQYSATAHAWDSLNPWASKTLFNYGWIYF